MFGRPVSVKNIFFRAGKRDVRQRLAIDEPASGVTKKQIGERDRERERQRDNGRRRLEKKSDRSSGQCVIAFQKVVVVVLTVV